MRGTSNSRGLYQVLCAKWGWAIRGEVRLLYVGKKIRTRKLLRESERCARALLRWGVRPGSAVFICASQTPELIYTLLALWKLGAIAHLMNPELPAEKQRACLHQRASELLFLTNDYRLQLQALLQEERSPQCVIMPTGQAAAPYGDMGGEQCLKTAGEERRFPRCMLWKEFVESGQMICAVPQPTIAGDQIAAVCYDFEEEKEGHSLSHRALCEAISLVGARQFSWGKGGRVLTLLPPWQAAGLAAMLLPLYQGQRLVLTCQSAKPNFAALHADYVIADSKSWLAATREACCSETGLSFLHGVYALQGGAEDLSLYHLVF